MRYLLVLTLALNTLVIAQKTSFWFPKSLWLTPRLEYELKDSSFLFLESDVRLSELPTQNLVSKYAYRSYLELGFEYVPENKYQLGGSAKWVELGNFSELYFQVYGRHWSNLFRQKFKKALLFDYVKQFDDGNIYTIQYDYLRWSIELGLENKITQNFGYSISYRSFQVVARDIAPSYKGRFFDLSRLKVGVDCFVKQHKLAVYTLLESNYYLITAAVPEYKLDQNRLVFGLAYTYRIVNNE